MQSNLRAPFVAWGVALHGDVIAINQATGLVTLKDLKTGNISQVTVTDPAKLKSLNRLAGRPQSLGGGAGLLGAGWRVRC